MAEEVRKLTCICCPRGCQMEARLSDGVVTSVTGNSCPRGDAYARKEVTAPTRVVTSTVPVSGQRAGEPAAVSVKTADGVPKGSIFKVILALKQAHPTAPVHIGDVIIPDVCGTGVDVVATKNVL